MSTKISFLGFAVFALVLSGCSQTQAPLTSSALPTTTNTPLMPPSMTATPTAVETSNPHVSMETSMGTIEFTLLADKAPKTVENFVTLAKSGFYDGVLFHRVIPNFMAQTGDPLSKDSDPYNDGTGGPGYKFADEIVPSLSNARGMIAMANSGPNTNGSQFYINVVDNKFLDGKYSVFGQVTKGLEIVDAITKVATNKTEPRLRDRPMKDVKVLKVTVE